MADRVTRVAGGGDLLAEQAHRGVDPAVLGRRLEGAVPLGRLVEPAEIAAVTTVLASDASSSVNGAEFHVDGGFAQV